MSENNQENNPHSEIQDAAVSIGVGTAVGVGTSAVVGGMGLAVAGTGVAIGLAPVVAAGAVVGTAVYGVQKAIEEQDATVLGAAAIGAGAGAGVSAIVGGMGLAVGGTAVAVTMAPIAIAGAVLGAAGYGLFKLFGGGDDTEHRVEEWARIKKIAPYAMGPKNYQRCLYDLGLGGHPHELEFNEDGSLKYQ
jgi:hypothetical protein